MGCHSAVEGSIELEGANKSIESNPCQCTMSTQLQQPQNVESCSAAPLVMGTAAMIYILIHPANYLLLHNS